MSKTIRFHAVYSRKVTMFSWLSRVMKSSDDGCDACVEFTLMRCWCRPLSRLSVDISSLLSLQFAGDEGEDDEDDVEDDDEVYDVDDEVGEDEKHRRDVSVVPVVADGVDVESIFNEMNSLNRI